MAIWTIQAKRQLRHSLARVLCEHSQKVGKSCLKPIDKKVKHLDEILSCTFPQADSIVVRDVMTGFRRKHEKHVLLVEVEQEDQGGPFVVKIGSASRLNDELRGWNCCRPVGLRHDLVLLPLRHGCTLPPDGEAEWMSLVYGDAQQFIGVERTVSLEEAFLDAVAYGNPSLQSIGTVLVELLERLGHLLYATSDVEDPAATDYVFRMPHVVRGIGLWNSDPFYLSIRSDTNVLVNHGISRFIDPVDYFRHWVLPYFSHEVQHNDGTVKVKEPTAPLKPLSADGTAGQIEVKAQDLVPYMLRGCAHGDLHGRNILVGLAHDRALWPTVFDYDDMSPCNLCGWDFVKLETELKVRAYRDVLSREELPFLHAVRDSEIALNELTERHHQDGTWPPVTEKDKPVERLRAALLEIRRMASLHLGRNRGRAKQWLEEYYFLLAAYGINMATYANLERRELVAAYVSAGVAASRLSWPRRREPWERRQFGL